MDRSYQFVKTKKLQPIQKCSAFNMLIEEYKELKHDSKILSKRIRFLESDAVWWILIHKVTSDNIVYYRTPLTFTLQSSSCGLKSRIWSCSVSGTANGKRFETISQPILTKDVSISKEIYVDLQKQSTLELKLEMKISVEEEDLDKIPMQKFIDSTRQYKNIISNNESILNESKYSDFTFIVHERMFKVHKSILAAASPVFDKLFETKFRETITNECYVNDIEPIAFQYLLDYIYCGKLPEEIHDGKVSRNLFEAAHYYEINELVDICTSVEHYNLSKNNAVDVYEWADTYGLEDVKMDAWKIIQFDILELFDAKQPPSIESIRSLIAINEEKKQLLQEYQRKFKKLMTSTEDLLK